MLLGGALSNEEQCQLYEHLCASARHTDEFQILSDTQSEPRDRPRPLTVWQHPYTGRSNIESKPQAIFDTASELAERGARAMLESDDSNAPILREQLALAQQQHNSLISLLYDEYGTLSSHTDGGLVGLGLSISLGASCTFTYGGQKLVLASGDALFGAFGQVKHKLWVMPVDSAPAWWRALPKTPRDLSGGSSAASFGRVRANLQFRRGRDAEARRKLREAGFEFYD